MPAPFHIIPGPVQVYVAPYGTVFPVLGVAPAGTWIGLGTNLDKDITEDGVTLRHSRATEIFRGLGTTAPRKSFATEEDLEIEFNLADMSMEAYSKALGAPATTAGNVTTVAGPPATKTVPLLRGFITDTVALLIRLGTSAYGEGTATFTTQWKIPMVQQVGNPEVVFVKGAPVALNHLYRAMWDPTLGFGVLEMGTA